MKKLFIVLLSLGLLFMFSCGNEENQPQIKSPIIMDSGAGAPGTLEYIPVRVYDVIDNGLDMTVLNQGFDESPQLRIIVSKTEEGSRGRHDILISVVDPDTSKIYSNYPVRVIGSYPDSGINVFWTPPTYPDGHGNKVYYTDEYGFLKLYARSGTGNVEYLTLDVGGYQYKIQFGSTEDD